MPAEGIWSLGRSWISIISNHKMLLLHIIMFMTDPILAVEVSPSSVTISPNDQFTVTCTARAEVDGQGLPVEILRWVRITTSSSASVNFFRLNSTEYDITVTGSLESGYQSVLTITENDTVNMITYRCRARISDISDVIVIKKVNISITHILILLYASLSVFCAIVFLYRKEPH